MLNWQKIAPGLYSSGQPTPQQWQQIRQAGVRTVLNLRPDDEQPGSQEAQMVADAGLRYCQLPVASGDAIDSACIDTFSALVDECAADGLLVHCGSGNRVGALVALRAHMHQQASDSEALQAGRKAGLTSLEPRVIEIMSRSPQA